MKARRILWDALMRGASTGALVAGPALLLFPLLPWYHYAVLGAAAAVGHATGIAIVAIANEYITHAQLNKERRKEGLAVQPLTLWKKEKQDR